MPREGSLGMVNGSSAGTQNFFLAIFFFTSGNNIPIKLLHKLGNLQTVNFFSFIYSISFSCYTSLNEVMFVIH